MNKKLNIDFAIAILILIALAAGGLIYFWSLEAEHFAFIPNCPINRPQKSAKTVVWEIPKDEKPFAEQILTNFQQGNFTEEFGQKMDIVEKLDKGINVRISVDKGAEMAELEFDNYDVSRDPYVFRGLNYRTDSMWFDVGLIVIGPEELYIHDKSGHETIPRYYYVKRNSLLNLGEVLKWKLADKFVGESFPQINITFYPSYLRVEEENYCCDTTYNVNDPDRKKYMKVFYLDAKTLDVLKEDKILRDPDNRGF